MDLWWIKWQALGYVIYFCTQPFFCHVIPPTMSKKEKQSLYKPGQALRVLGGWGSQLSRQLAHEGGKVVSPTHRPPLPQEIFLVLNSVRGWVDPRATKRPEGLCQWKIPMTPSGIEPATFRLDQRCVLILLSVADAVYISYLISL